jgi:hypothetical protein
MRNPLCIGIITDCQAQNCIDVSRATKQNQSIPVNSKFQYFVLMCFYCCRIEHVIRTYTKAWLDGQPLAILPGQMAPLRSGMTLTIGRNVLSVAKAG